MNSSPYLVRMAVHRILRGLSFAVAVGMNASPGSAAELPVACVAAACGPGVTQFVSHGLATAASNGSALTVTQTTDSATLNWQSFNISRDGKVEFRQPDANSVALNRIFQSSPSRIFGSLTANGRVYLLNQNGVLFGNGAEVNVAGLIASSLDITPSALSPDGATNLTGAGRASQAAFAQYDNGLPSGDVTVLQGADLSTAEGGQVFLFAPRVMNSGTIRTPGGQTVLAAGESVFLATSSDVNLRGILVEVGVGGEATNGELWSNANATDPGKLVGQIIAERGNITLAGAAVNQLGRVSATTSVSEGGSIRLIARDGGTATNSGDAVFLAASRGGDLQLGRNSRTEIRLDANGAATVDSNPQPVSNIELEGDRIVIWDDARVIAPHGNVNVLARADSALPPDQFSSGGAAASRIYIGDGALIDVAGARIDKPMESNLLAVELRGDELADSELQRNGPLRGKTVYIDVRQSGTRDDGSEWVGSPIGELSGWLSTVARNVDERSLTGGKVLLRSQGDVILDKGSKVDISGGAIKFADGYVNTSQVVGADGNVHDISEAEPTLSYTGIRGGVAYKATDTRWGVTTSYASQASRGHFESGYAEGKDAGSLTVLGKQVVLDGDVAANTEVGVHQRQLSSALVANAASSLYRPGDQLPLTGELILGQTSGQVQGARGRDYMLSDVAFANKPAPVLSADFDPLNDELSESLDQLLLDATLFSEGLGRLTLRANGTVTLPAAVAVSMPAGGRLDVLAGTIHIAGDVISHGGSIRLVAAPTQEQLPLDGGLTLHSGAKLDVSGTWVNDQMLANSGSEGTAPLTIDGGSVVLQAQSNSLAVEEGSLMDVSAGARFTTAGRLQAGRGGAISVANTQGTNGEVTTLSLDGELRAQAFADGGRLSISTGGVCIASVLANCGDASYAGLLWLDPARFTHGGFASYSIASNPRGVQVADGTKVILQQRNLVANQAVAPVATGTDIDTFTNFVLLPDIDRNPTNLSLSVSPSLFSGNLFDSTSFAHAANLEIGSGAALIGDAGAIVTLTSSSRLLVDGTVAAPAGEISLHLTSALGSTGNAGADVYFEDQGIWLGSRARLQAGGATLVVADDLGRTTGDVLDGGRISIDADRGHVLISAGSLLDVSGTHASLDVRSDASGSHERREIGSAGGVIRLEAAEAIAMGGEIRGHSGKPGDVAGGTLAVNMDASLRADPGLTLSENQHSRYPTGNRIIEVGQQHSPAAFANSYLPQRYQGRAVVSVDQVADGGFDSLQLSAATYWTNENSSTPNTAFPGEIDFDGDVDLQLARSVALYASILKSNGGDVAIDAPLVWLGNPLLANNQQVHAAVASGTGSLHITAQQLDLIGASVAQGFDTVSLRSDGDLRLRGVRNVNSELVGSLGTAGDLLLSATQIYPTTLTDFTLQAGVNDATRTLTINQNGTPGAALSAGGTLRLRAPHVVQSGTLRAPFGTIDIESPSILLAPSSVTSTSGKGLVVPFGETQGGLDWVYGLGTTNIVYGEDGRALPSQRVNLRGDNIQLASGATIDVQGGGELVGSEFLSGPTGKQDILGADNDSGSFAILPAANLASAAYDEGIWLDSGVSGETTITLDGFGDVPAGDYFILPARYALLPGGYLVTPTAGFQDISTGETHRLSDGSVLVAGHYNYTGSGLQSSARSAGFAVLPGKAIQNKSRYTVTGADQFFSKDSAPEKQRLPRDAGTVAVQATTALALNGVLAAAAAKDGRGAGLDISSNAIRVVANAAGAAPAPGVLTLDAGNLNALGAESLLIGGTRSVQQDGLAVNAVATAVRLVDGAVLRGPEVMLVATDTVQVGNGASVEASGAEVQADEIKLTGDGAFMRVATSGAAAVDRELASGSRGNVDIAGSATLRATNGSIVLESSRGAVLAGSLQAEGGEVALTGARINLGNAPAATPGWTLSAQQLSGLAADTLSLTSRSFIDLYGDVSLDLVNLNVEAGGVRGQNAGTVDISASGDVTLRGDSAGAAVSAATGGTLSIAGRNVHLDGGALEFSGIGNFRLGAGEELRAEESSSLTVGGDLSLVAQRMTATSGAALEIMANGATSIAASTTNAALAPVDELGGSLSVVASSIAVATSIEMPSGLVNLAATGTSGGGVTLASGASIDTSGRSTAFDDELAYSPGGEVTLSAASGNVAVAQGSSVDVSADGGAAAGRVNLAAISGAVNVAGTLTGGSSGGAHGADISVDAQSISGFANFTHAIAEGEFSGDVSLRLRGPGNIVVAAGEANAIRGTSVSLTADQGAVQVAGIVAAHDRDGGRIELNARDDVTVSGTLDARATSGNERNGRIALSSVEGGVRTTGSAVLATLGSAAADGSAADGDVSIRTSQASLQTVIDGASGNDAVNLAGDWHATRSTTVEGFKVHVDADGVLDFDETMAGTSPWYTAASTFAEQSGAIESALGASRIPSLQVVSGIEIRSGASDGTLRLDTDWNMADWRFAGRPGVVTLRATGDLTFTQSLSDGFVNSDTHRLETGFGDSWSYRLIAGADASSADVMATRQQPALATNGNLIVAGSGDSSSSSQYVAIRTGSGSIDVAAAGDVIITDDSAMIYTAGVASPGMIYQPLRGEGSQLDGLYYPAGGGDVTIRAGRDVLGAPGHQLANEWLWRIGNVDGTTTRSTAWTVNFDSFHQGLGALGGGDVHVRAGRDIQDLAASTPSIGRQRDNLAGDKSAGANNLEVIGGGDVVVDAGRDIAGGAYYSGRGSIELTAAGSVRTSNHTGHDPLLLLGDTRAVVMARNDLSIESAITPTLLPQGFSQGTAGSTASDFSTYGEGSGVDLASTAGDVLVDASLETLIPQYGWEGDPVAAEIGLTLLPPQVHLLAHRGAAGFAPGARLLALAPSSDGYLDVRAYRDVKFNAIVSDIATDRIPSADKPASTFVHDIQVPAYGALASWGSANANEIFNASIPVRQQAADEGTLQSSRIVSATGDVSGAGYFGGPLLVNAGRDVSDLNVRVQNLTPADVSSIDAARDITYAITRLPNGKVLQNPLAIDVDGPGQLLLTAGRNIDLRASSGITTRGNLVNNVLDAVGAGIGALAGVNGQEVDYTAFRNFYVEEGGDYADALVSYMEQVSGARPASAEQALAQFDALHARQRQAFYYRILLQEVSRSAKEAASVEDSGNYTRGFKALETLFPGSTSKNNPFLGEVNLFFSRIYTADGGDLSLLAPGGGVNVGLAAPPAGFGIDKSPGDLGLVTRNGGHIGIITDQDVQVNESRIFAVNDSDITVWSSNGDIDAGRGAKTAISAPAPVVTYDRDGHAFVTYNAALSGSGIQTRVSTLSSKPGNVVLAAPRGVVNAGDAGIVAGNLTIAATAVLGADNIKVSGVAVGVPIDTGGLGASLAGVSAAASGASSAATSVVGEGSDQKDSAPLSEAALSWLEVFVTGLGEDNCRQDDLECLRRQR